MPKQIVMNQGTHPLLIMASVFPPQKYGGGPAVSLGNLVTNLDKSRGVYVISHNHEIGQKESLVGVDPNKWNNFDGAYVYYLDYRKFTVGNILNLMKEIRPSCIYQNSFFSYEQMIATLLYKRFFDSSTKVIIVPRGELADIKLKMKRVKKKLYCSVLKCSGFLRNVIWQGTCSSEIDEIRKFAGAKAIIWNVANIPCSHAMPVYSVKKEVGELNLVFIGRIHPIKNLHTGIEALRIITSNVNFDIYGPIEDEKYWDICKNEISKLPDNISVHYCGFVEHDCVSEVLTTHHAMFTPTGGENFGQSIVDSMLNGRPVITSNMTPWSDLQDRNAGYVCGLDDITGYSQSIEKLAAMDASNFISICMNAYDYAITTLNVDLITKEYEAMFSI